MIGSQLYLNGLGRPLGSVLFFSMADFYIKKNAYLPSVGAGHSFCIEMECKWNAR